MTRTNAEVIGRTRRLDPADVDLPAFLVGSDYVDVHQVTAAEPDARTPEEVVRSVWDGSPGAIQQAILAVHKNVLGFHLGPADSAEHVIGWRVTESTPDHARLEADGPLMSGTLVLRRVGPTTAQLITGLRYRQPRAALVWRFVGPLHRTAAPYFMNRTV